MNLQFDILFSLRWIILLPCIGMTRAQLPDENVVVECCARFASDLEMSCDRESAIHVGTVELVGNKDCDNRFCCTNTYSCQTSVANENDLADFYADVMACNGKSSCVITPPDTCPDTFPLCAWSPVGSTFIHINFTCILASTTIPHTTASPTTPPLTTPTMTYASETTGRSATVQLTSTYVAMTTATHNATTSSDIGLWVGVAVGILCVIVGITLLIVCLQRRTPRIAAAPPLIKSDTAWNINNDIYMSDVKPAGQDNTTADEEENYVNYDADHSFHHSFQYPQTELGGQPSDHCEPTDTYDYACAMPVVPSADETDTYVNVREEGSSDYVDVNLHMVENNAYI